MIPHYQWRELTVDGRLVLPGREFCGNFETPNEYEHGTFRTDAEARIALDKFASTFRMRGVNLVLVEIYLP